MMKLWLLRVHDSVGLYQHNGFVIRAESAQEARAMAAARAFTGEKKRWKNSKKSLCVQFKEEGNRCIIIADCRAEERTVRQDGHQAAV
jgi:hypothetical protein